MPLHTLGEREKANRVGRAGVDRMAIAALGLCLLAACRSTDLPNQRLASNVDIERFMGSWYVHGYTPTFLDRDAFGAIESYELRDDGKIQTTYRFRKGGPSGKEKVYRPVGWVHDTASNAEWRMRFFGMFTAPYYVVYASDDYEYTIIGHPNKRLAWVMSRSPRIGEGQYGILRDKLAALDYDLESFQRVSHD